MLPALPAALTAIAEVPRKILATYRRVGPSTLMFQGVPVVVDPKCPPGMLYFVSSDVFNVPPGGAIDDAASSPSPENPWPPASS